MIESTRDMTLRYSPIVDGQQWAVVYFIGTVKSYKGDPESVPLMRAQGITCFLEGRSLYVTMTAEKRSTGWFTLETSDGVKITWTGTAVWEKPA